MLSRISPPDSALPLNPFHRRGFFEAPQWSLLVFVVLLLGVAAYSWPVFSGFGHTLYSYSGDAWKNIYTVAYYVAHDDALLHTDSLNWPWGDHIVMADTQPVVSWGLKILYGLGLIGETGITYAVLLLPIVSVAISGVVLYHLFRSFEVPNAMAALWACPVAIMGPQLFRINGHYALGYMWVLPMLLLIWMRARRSTYSWRWILALSAYCVLMIFIHFYYVGLIAATIIALFALESIRGSWSDRGLAVARMATVVAPAVIISTVFVRASDFYDDRIASPYGLEEYVSKPIALFVEIRNPVYAALGESIGGFDMPSGEGWAYLGFWLAWTLVATVLYLLFRYFRSLNSPEKKVRYDERLVVMGLSALVLLIFSWGYPLGLSGEIGDMFRDASGPLKQLRSLGRFTWPAYYLLTCIGVVITTVYLGRWRWGRVAGYVGLGIAWLEALTLLLVTPQTGVPHVLLESKHEIARIIDSVGVDAIIPLPYFNVGSEDFVKGEIGSGLYTGTYPSLASGIPNVGLYLARTSFAQAVQSVELASSWWNPPGLLRSPGGQHIYLLAIDRVAFAQNNWLNDVYGSIYGLAETIYKDEFLVLAVLKEEQITQAVEQKRSTYLEQWFPGTKEDGFSVADTGNGSSGLYYRNAFDSRRETIGLDGPGALTLAGGGRVELADVKLSEELVSGGSITVGFHLRLEDQGQIYAPYEVFVTDSSGTQIAKHYFWAHLSFHEIDERWIYVATDIPVAPSARHIRIVLTPSRKARTVGGVVDEVTVSATGSSFLYRLGETIVANGRLLRPLLSASHPYK